jgi:hypothetical protein
VGSGGAFGNFGSAALQDDQRLMTLDGFARDGEQFFGLFKSLDKGGNDLRVFILDEIIKVFLEGGAGLIAAGYDMAEANVAIEHQGVGDGRAQAAALGNQRDRPRKKARRNAGREQWRLAKDIEHAITVRAADEKSTLARQRFEARLAIFPLSPGLGESSSEYHGGANTGVCSGF